MNLTDAQIIEWAREGRAFLISSELVNSWSMYAPNIMECHLDESRYSLDHNYKISLSPHQLIESFHFYISDLKILIQDGVVIVRD